ncbi:hypothetical protein ElyMa_005383500 [Elysia marginata]|uniref:Uncharacterized protein n=1 Tax=Elysia marginata TaxID=1093978 RepID=A0AAV4EEU9_9GAST|nr:hypothetical protein ElyMa_005383500 [Elysia marginata]
MDRAMETVKLKASIQTLKTLTKTSQPRSSARDDKGAILLKDKDQVLKRWTENWSVFYNYELQPDLIRKRRKPISTGGRSNRINTCSESRQVTWSAKRSRRANLKWK